MAFIDATIPNNGFGSGLDMVRRLQNPMPQPNGVLSTVDRRRRAACRDCGKDYGVTKRTYCPPCDTFTVEATSN